MIFVNTQKRAAMLASSMLVALASPSFAQTFDDIIVTATKSPVPLSEIGASVAIVDGTELELFDGAEDLVERLSGVQAAVANGSQIAFQIRGIGAVDHQALTPTAAAIYLDNTYLSTNVQTSPLLFDIERAEVLKGPQGSLYGRNASGGAINFISVKPGDDSEGYVSVGYGNFNRLNVTGAATVPVSDIFSFRVAGRYLTQDPALENTVTNGAVEAPGDAGGKRDEFGVRAIGHLKASPNTDVIMNVHYAEDNGVNAAPRNSSLSVEDHQISIGPDGVQDTDNEFYGASVNVTHDYDNVTLVSHTAYEGYNQQYGFDFDGSPAPFGVASLNANLAYDRDLTLVSQEFQLKAKRGESDFMAGVYLEAEDFEQEYLIWCGVLDRDTLLGTCRYVGAPGRAGPTPASPGTATTLQSLINQSRKTAALFTYNTLAVSPNLDVVLGGRLTHETIEASGEGRHYFDDGLIALNNRDGLGLAIGENKITENRFSGQIGLNYTLADDSLLYASFSNGFKSGGFNGEVINNATHFADEGLFEAETVNAFEAGVKFKRDRFRMNAAGFYQFYDRPQARIFVPFNLANGGSFTSNSLSNLDEAVSYGLEADMVWTPREGFDLNASVTWLDTQINQEENPAVPQNAANFDGNPLPFASELSATLGARYEWAVNETLSASVEANGKYQSSFFLDAEGLEDRKQDGYVAIDGSAGLHFASQFELGVWARNLTNEDYAVSGFGFIGYNTFRSQPRSYGVVLKYAY